MILNPISFNGLSICCTMSSKGQKLKVHQSLPALSLHNQVHAGLGANCCYSGYVGEHHKQGKCLQPGRAALWECVPRILLLSRVTEDQAEALRVWSAVGVLAVPGILGLWEAWRCQ